MNQSRHSNSWRLLMPRIFRICVHLKVPRPGSRPNYYVKPDQSSFATFENAWQALRNWIWTFLVPFFDFPHLWFRCLHLSLLLIARLKVVICYRYYVCCGFHGDFVDLWDTLVFRSNGNGDLIVNGYLNDSYFFTAGKAEQLFFHNWYLRYNLWMRLKGRLHGTSYLDFPG